MRLPPPFQPKRPRLFAVATVVGASSVGLGIGMRAWRGWSAGDALGLTFGALAALLMVLAALYAVRRQLMVPPLKTAQDWLQLHVYGSTLAAVFVLVHAGFRWPHGQFGWWLLGLTIWTTGSGLLGVALQKWVPALIAGQLNVEVIYERVPEMLERLQKEAASTMDGASEALQRYYSAQVQPLLAGVTPSWAYVFDASRGRAVHMASFEHMQAFVDESDQPRLADLRSIVSEKLEIEAHYSLQHILRLWPVLHVPPAMLLLAAMTAHIAAVWYF